MMQQFMRFCSHWLQIKAFHPDKDNTGCQEAKRADTFCTTTKSLPYPPTSGQWGAQQKVGSREDSDGREVTSLASFWRSYVGLAILSVEKSLLIPRWSSVLITSLVSPPFRSQDMHGVGEGSKSSVVGGPRSLHDRSRGE